MKVDKGCKVKIEYEGKLADGTVFDSTKHGDHAHPLEFVVGSGQVIPGFEEGVLGMSEGDEKDIEISPEKAYGEKDDSRVQEIPREQLPKDQEPKVGMVLMLNSPDGRQIPLKIKEVSNDKVVVDLNHPLAGEKLFFHVKVVGVESNS